MCQAFMLKTKDSQVLIGRTMEFPPIKILKKLIDVWYACFVPVNTPFDCRVGDVGLQWQSKFEYIGLTGVSEAGKQELNKLIGAPLKGYYCIDGVNQRCLSASALMYEKNMIWSPEGGSSSNVLYMMFVDYILGMYENVATLRRDIAEKKLGVFGFDGGSSIYNQPAHFIVHDRWGDCVVIEVDKETLNMYDENYLKDNNLQLHSSALNHVLFGQLTNTPSFVWQMNNLRQYLHLSPNDAQKLGDKSTLEQTSHGSGMVGLPGDQTSPSRFLRLSNVLRFVPQPNNLNEAYILANHMLNSMTIIDGMVIEATDGQAPNKHDITQWVAIKDLTDCNPILHCRTYNTHPLAEGSPYQSFSFKDFPKEAMYYRLLHQKGENANTQVREKELEQATL
jgi:choloylglycine hydrolase